MEGTVAAVTPVHTSTVACEGGLGHRDGQLRGSLEGTEDWGVEMVSVAGVCKARQAGGVVGG